MFYRKKEKLFYTISLYLSACNLIKIIHAIGCERIRLWRCCGIGARM